MTDGSRPQSYKVVIESEFTARVIAEQKQLDHARHTRGNEVEDSPAHSTKRLRLDNDTDEEEGDAKIEEYKIMAERFNAFENFMLLNILERKANKDNRDAKSKTLPQELLRIIRDYYWECSLFMKEDATVDMMWKLNCLFPFKIGMLEKIYSMGGYIAGGAVVYMLVDGIHPKTVNDVDLWFSDPESLKQAVAYVAAEYSLHKPVFLLGDTYITVSFTEKVCYDQPLRCLQFVLVDSSSPHYTIRHFNFDYTQCALVFDEGKIENPRPLPWSILKTQYAADAHRSRIVTVMTDTVYSLQTFKNLVQKANAKGFSIDFHTLETVDLRFYMYFEPASDSSRIAYEKATDDIKELMFLDHVIINYTMENLLDRTPVSSVYDRIRLNNLHLSTTGIQNVFNEKMTKMDVAGFDAYRPKSTPSQKVYVLEKNVTYKQYISLKYTGKNDARLRIVDTSTERITSHYKRFVSDIVYLEEKVARPNPSILTCEIFKLNALKTIYRGIKTGDIKIVRGVVNKLFQTQYGGWFEWSQDDPCENEADEAIRIVLEFFHRYNDMGKFI